VTAPEIFYFFNGLFSFTLGAVGFYADEIFPRVMDWIMRAPRFQELRRQVLAPARGHVLEIGFGTGLNLPHYPRSVTWLTAVDPANFPNTLVEKQTRAGSIPVKLVRLSAETLPFESGQFDWAVSTWTLCTIPDPVSALREVRRVLKPGGQFIFLEHGRSDDPKVLAWQNRLNPLQRLIACGCNLNRSIDALIRQAGLTITQMERFQMAGVPRVAGAMYRGIATPHRPILAEPSSSGRFRPIAPGASGLGTV
jgi:ubiquinone/menaquinone biosynthesis C-methylase UbiE